MARQHSAQIVGTFGDLIFYNWRGKYYMRTKPKEVKRTASSVGSGLNFGKASKMAAQVRRAVDSALLFFPENLIFYRLTGAINRWIKWKGENEGQGKTLPAVMEYIPEFQFNDDADLTRFPLLRAHVQSTPSGSTEMILDALVPAESVKAPANTNYLTVRMALLSLHISEATTEIIGKTEIRIPYNDSTFAQTITELPNNIPADRLAILVMSLQYTVDGPGGLMDVKDKKRRPCGIVWCQYQ